MPGQSTLAQPPTHIRRYPPLCLFTLVNGIFLGGILFPLMGWSWLILCLPPALIVHALLFISDGKVVHALDQSLLGQPLSKRLALSFTVFVLLIGGAEIFTRTMVRLRIWKKVHPITFQVPKGTEDWRVAMITADKRYEADPVLFWRPKPQPPYNAARFQGPEVRSPKPDHTYRIICYGDSNTEGVRAKPWPGFLAGNLMTLLGGNSPKIEVLNAGVAGYSSHQGLLRFTRELEAYQPDLVTVSFGWNDLTEAIGQPDKHFEPPSALGESLQEFLFKFRAYKALRKFVRNSLSQDAESVGPRVSREDYLQNMQRFADTAREANVQIVFLTRPHRGSEKDWIETGENWRKEVPLYNGALRDFAGTGNYPLVDAQQFFESRFPDAFLDQCHITQPGHSLLAAEIARDLVRRELIALR